MNPTNQPVQTPPPNLTPPKPPFPIKWLVAGLLIILVGLGAFLVIQKKLPNLIATKPLPTVSPTPIPLTRKNISVPGFQSNIFSDQGIITEVVESPKKFKVKLGSGEIDTLVIQDISIVIDKRLNQQTSAKSNQLKYLTFKDLADLSPGTKVVFSFKEQEVTKDKQILILNLDLID